MQLDSKLIKKTIRSVKGVPLTHDELDFHFEYASNDVQMNIEVDYTGKDNTEDYILFFYTCDMDYFINNSISFSGTAFVLIPNDESLPLDRNSGVDKRFFPFSIDFSYAEGAVDEQLNLVSSPEFVIRSSDDLYDYQILGAISQDNGDGTISFGFVTNSFEYPASFFVQGEVSNGIEIADFSSVSAGA